MSDERTAKRATLLLTRRLFISVEGLSGSGKTTVATLLSGWLGAHYYKTPPEMFLPIRDRIEANASPVARYLYYYAGIAQASAEIESLLTKSSVVCDKFTATMLAYSQAGGVNVETPPNRTILVPDLSFWLDVPDAIRLARLSARGSITPAHAAFLQMERDSDVRAQFRKLGLIHIENVGPGVEPALDAIANCLRRAAPERVAQKEAQDRPWPAA